MSFQIIWKCLQSTGLYFRLPGAVFTHSEAKNRWHQVKAIMDQASQTIFFVLSFATFGVIQANSFEKYQYPAYPGLELANVPQHELAGLDLYMDILVEFCIICIAIALGIPMLKLRL